MPPGQSPLKKRAKTPTKQKLAESPARNNKKQNGAAGTPPIKQKKPRAGTPKPKPHRKAATAPQTRSNSNQENEPNLMPPALVKCASLGSLGPPKAIKLQVPEKKQPEPVTKATQMTARPITCVTRRPKSPKHGSFLQKPKEQEYQILETKTTEPPPKEKEGKGEEPAATPPKHSPTRKRRRRKKPENEKGIRSKSKTQSKSFKQKIAKWARKGKLEKEEYYHGLVPREDVKSLLDDDGDFLVRHTEVQGKKTYVISIKIDEQAKHLAIKVTADGTYTLGSVAFETIDELVRHHMTTPIPTDPKPTLLKKPIPKAEWELKHRQVELLEKLGEGAFGEVYKGKLKLPHGKKVLVAVKCSRLSDLSKAEIQEIMKESRMMRKYEHPNIVKLYGVAAEQEPILIVMELVSGGTVKKYVQKQKEELAVPELIKLCLDAARGLNYLHEQSCVHRDVAARNCLISEDTTVKISDFGLSFQGEATLGDKQTKVPIKWLAPETLNSRIYTSSTDVWSYGVMMWEVFSFGTEPYPGMTSLEVQKEVRNGYRMAPPPTMPVPISELMSRCWKDKPQDRPSFGDIVGEINGYTQSLYCKVELNVN